MIEASTSHPLSAVNQVDRIRTAVYRSISGVNDLLPPAQALPQDDTVVLIGPGAMLDSMGFVNFVVALEEELERELQRGITIPELLAVQDEKDAALTVADLINVLSARLG